MESSVSRESERVTDFPDSLIAGSRASASFGGLLEASSRADPNLLSLGFFSIALVSSASTWISSLISRSAEKSIVTRHVPGAASAPRRAASVGIVVAVLGLFWGIHELLREHNTVLSVAFSVLAFFAGCLSLVPLNKHIAILEQTMYSAIQDKQQELSRLSIDVYRVEESLEHLNEGEAVDRDQVRELRATIDALQAHLSDAWSLYYSTPRRKGMDG
jgi:hypothetical protein